MTYYVSSGTLNPTHALRRWDLSVPAKKRTTDLLNLSFCWICMAVSIRIIASSFCCFDSWVSGKGMLPIMDNTSPAISKGHHTCNILKMIEARAGEILVLCVWVVNSADVLWGSFYLGCPLRLLCTISYTQPCCTDCIPTSPPVILVSWHYCGKWLYPVKPSGVRWLH